MRRSHYPLPLERCTWMHPPLHIDVACVWQEALRVMDAYMVRMAVWRAPATSHVPWATGCVLMQHGLLRAVNDVVQFV